MTLWLSLSAEDINAKYKACGLGWTRTYKDKGGKIVTEYIEPERIYLTTIEWCELLEIRKNDESKRVYCSSRKA